MKTAIIYFEGKEICQVKFDEVYIMGSSVVFLRKKEDIASFPDTYGYVVEKENPILPVSTQDIINAQEAGRNAAKGL